MPYIPTVRKVKKDRVAQAMARKRWAGKSKEQRMATARNAWEARSRKAAERREAQSVVEPEAVSA